MLLYHKEKNSNLPASFYPRSCIPDVERISLDGQNNNGNNNRKCLPSAIDKRRPARMVVIMACFLQLKTKHSPLALLGRDNASRIGACNSIGTHAIRPVDESLFQSLVHEVILAFALHHHHALLPQGIHGVHDGILICRDRIQLAGV